MPIISNAATENSPTTSVTFPFYLPQIIFNLDYYFNVQENGEIPENEIPECMCDKDLGGDYKVRPNVLLNNDNEYNSTLRSDQQEKNFTRFLKFMEDDEWKHSLMILEIGVNENKGMLKIIKDRIT